MKAAQYVPETRIARLIREEHLEHTVATGVALADFVLAVWRVVRPAPALRRPARAFVRPAIR